MRTIMITLTAIILLTTTAAPQNSLEQVWLGLGENTFDHFGAGCCGGDFNNDGYSDVLIGALGWPGMLYNIGKDYLYFGSPDFITEPFMEFIGDTIDNGFDFRITNVQDIDGDQVADFMIPAYGTRGGGWIEIYCCGANLDTIPDIRIEKYATEIWEVFGVSNDSAGDVNNDGWDDIVIAGGDTEFDYNYFEIYHGGASFDTIPDWRYSTSVLPNYYFFVYGLGDVNGDGFDDILAYKPSWGFPALLFFGGSPMDTIPDLEFYEYAIEASGIGDVNDDGYADIAMYQRFDDSTWYDVVYFGGLDMDNVPDVELTHWNGTRARSPYGFSCGDVNGDGINDVIAGTTWNNPFVYVYLGSPEFNGMVDVWYFDYNMDGNPIPATGVGDVNGDGCCDIMVCSPNDGGAGKAFMLAGNPDLIDIGAAVEPEDLQHYPGWFKLDQNYPNPFNAVTVIPLHLPEKSRVKMTIYDLSGCRVAHLFDGIMEAGMQKIRWNARNDNPIPSGIYFLKVEGEGELSGKVYTSYGKLLLLK